MGAFFASNFYRFQEICRNKQVKVTAPKELGKGEAKGIAKGR
jgi:hypothetical protein